MIPKRWIIASLVTLGLVPLAWMAWRKVTEIDVGRMPADWWPDAGYDPNAFHD